MQAKFEQPQREINYPPEAKAVVDVTQAPFCLDNTGRLDCTEKLVQIIDEVINSSYAALQDVISELEAAKDPNARLSFENRKENGQVIAIFPDHVPVNRIIYFPKGVYRVSDTISYSGKNITNSQSAELNWCIRLMGQSRSETVIKLDDKARGFEYGMARPVISFIRGKWSNIAMSNFIENLTIDTGSGNPGAIGLEFFGNNCAAVRDITIRSSDKDHSGEAGISISRETVSGCLFSNIEVDGFDYGVKITPHRSYVCFDNLHLRNQQTTGFMLNHMIVPVSRLYSHNSVSAVTLTGPTAHLSLTDSVLSGNNSGVPAIDFQDGQLFVSNSQVDGYSCSIGERRLGISMLDCGNIDQYVSHSVSSGHGQLPEKSTLGLEVKFTPVKPEFGAADWACVDDFGADSTGQRDSSAAIQQAMNSSKAVIYFQPGKYLIDSIIKIPASVQAVNFMFTDLIAGENIKQLSGKGMFTVSEDANCPLFIEDMFARERNFGAHYLIDHASRRTVVLSDLHSQSCAMYINSVSGGEVFIDNVISTPGIGPEKYWHSCFVFKGQKVWAIQINAEYGDPEILNDKSQLWVLGFKTEGPWTCFKNINGGQCEILGGMLNIGNDLEYPAIINIDSDISIVASSNGNSRTHKYPNVIKNTQSGMTEMITDTQLPPRFAGQFTIPLFVSKTN